MGVWSRLNTHCQIVETNYIYSSFYIYEYCCSKSHKLSSKPVIMANGKQASGLVPRVAQESWALSQLALGPGRSSTKSSLSAPQSLCATVLSTSAQQRAVSITYWSAWSIFLSPGWCSMTSYQDRASWATYMMKLRFGKTSLIPNVARLYYSSLIWQSSH